MPHEFLTVPELAELLRIKERKVYDLAASGLVPCTRATGKLLFPENEVRAWIASQQVGSKSARPAVFLGSHDPLLEWALRQSQCGLATFFDGSTDGLDRFLTDQGIATGLHIPEVDGWNVSTVKQRCNSCNAVLVHWAKRARGLVTKPDQKSSSAEVSNLNGRRIAFRQASSGTAALFDKLMAEHRVSYEAVGPYYSEQDAVLSVLNGEADVAFGLQTVAEQFDLSFNPLVQEEFDLLFDRAAYFEPPLQKFLTFCRSEEFLFKAASHSGYSMSEMGTVRWNAGKKPGE